MDPSPLVETDAVQSRLGIELRLAAGEGGLVSGILKVSPVVTTLSPLGASWLSVTYFVREIGQSERVRSRNALAPSGLS